MVAQDLREHLVGALRADLVGPYAEDEVLRLPPSRWYLTGFLVPRAGREVVEDPTQDEELAAGNDENEEETSGAEPEPKQKNRLPASMGLSVLLPPGPATEAVTVTLRWAEYMAEEQTREDGRRARPVWRRVVRGPTSVSLPLDRARVAAGVAVPGAPGIVIKGKLEETDAPGLPHGARALSVFVVNERVAGEKGRQDEQFLFQVELELRYERGLLARPNQRDADSTDWDERVADLQFRDRMAYAVGHGVSVVVPEGDPVVSVRTTWIPRAEVPRVVTYEGVAATVAMEGLADLADGAAARRALVPIVEAYGAWIEGRRREPLAGTRAETRDQMMRGAERARGRIAAGIELLAADATVLEAFRLANRAMAMQARRRSPAQYEGGKRPTWRLFQIAFVLLNLPSVADETHGDRDTVELIFFPTGGGKTEAYLGVVTFTLLLRRLRGQERPDRGLGVAVLLRYTLRLLTLDQLGRAATLMCALEMIRREQPGRLGDVRFAVGLWVGRGATANTLSEVAERITEYKASSAKNPPSPLPITDCPWCGTRLGPDSFALLPSKKKPTEVVVGCLDRSCDFAAARHAEGLPVLFVDEQIYRELPAFVVATVDKFAMLPWRGETGMLFGRAQARRGRSFFGPLDGKETGTEKLPDGLRPPELIIQDELHLISGPLGTMVGLYETALEALCMREEGGKRIRPKILASTATVRRAADQIQALMGRKDTQVFPPPGIDEWESFFARVDADTPGRAYVGVAAPGRALKAILLRSYVALLCAAEKLHAAGPEAADGYMTVAGYFNSLRELGGMRRLIEDDVRVRCARADERRPSSAPAPHRWAASRALQKEPVELTSREHTSRIAESKARLARPHTDESHIDVLLASNMISVGVDIDRLGLMVVAGQPKTTAEYIQCTSRVGRDVRWPGLVVTCFNVHKPRDRSHYEQFAAYHESFYRFVEVTSLTPFSGPALDRGMAGALIAMTRLLDTVMTPAEAAMEIERNRSLGEEAIRRLAERGGLQPGVDGARHEQVVTALAARGRNVLDAWVSIVTEARKDAGRRSYSPYDRDRAAGKALLHTPLDEDRPPEGTDEAKFAAPISMRDVEPSAHLWLERRHLGSKG